MNTRTPAVIPAKAGIHSRGDKFWIPAFAGMTGWIPAFAGMTEP